MSNHIPDKKSSVLKGLARVTPARVELMRDVSELSLRAFDAVTQECVAAGAGSSQARVSNWRNVALPDAPTLLHLATASFDRRLRPCVVEIHRDFGREFLGKGACAQGEQRDRLVRLYRLGHEATRLQLAGIVGSSDAQLAEQARAHDEAADAHRAEAVAARMELLSRRNERRKAGAR